MANEITMEIIEQLGSLNETSNLYTILHNHFKGADSIEQ